MQTNCIPTTTTKPCKNRYDTPGDKEITVNIITTKNTLIKLITNNRNH